MSLAVTSGRHAVLQYLVDKDGLRASPSTLLFNQRPAPHISTTNLYLPPGAPQHHLLQLPLVLHGDEELVGQLISALLGAMVGTNCAFALDAIHYDIVPALHTAIVQGRARIAVLLMQRLESSRQSFSRYTVPAIGSTAMFALSELVSSSGSSSSSSSSGASPTVVTAMMETVLQNVPRKALLGARSARETLFQRLAEAGHVGALRALMQWCSGIPLDESGVLHALEPSASSGQLGTLELAVKAVLASKEGGAAGRLEPALVAGSWAGHSKVVEEADLLSVQEENRQQYVLSTLCSGGQQAQTAALMAASRNGHTEGLLQKAHGCGVRDTQFAALTVASGLGHVGVVRELLCGQAVYQSILPFPHEVIVAPGPQGPLSQHVDPVRCRALIEACAGGHEGVVEALLLHGASALVSKLVLSRALDAAGRLEDLEVRLAILRRLCVAPHATSGPSSHSPRGRGVRSGRRGGG
jgi:hypothetical protein